MTTVTTNEEIAMNNEKTAQAHNYGSGLGSYEFFPKDPKTVNFSQHNFGWICPRCRKIYAPENKECFSCNSGAQFNGGVGDIHVR